MNYTTEDLNKLGYRMVQAIAKGYKLAGKHTVDLRSKKTVLIQTILECDAAAVAKAMSTSVDGLNAGQINKFVACFKMKNLRMVDGHWTADDVYDNGEIDTHTITADMYWSAWHSGDLAA